MYIIVIIIIMLIIIIVYYIYYFFVFILCFMFLLYLNNCRKTITYIHMFFLRIDYTIYKKAEA